MTTLEHDHRGPRRRRPVRGRRRHRRLRLLRPVHGDQAARGRASRTSSCSSAATQVGGTWWFNTYPGCGCDVPSHLYSFSFAPNPDWTRTYSRQPEIEAYLQRVAEDFDLGRSVRLGTTVTGADWDEDEQRWHVETDRGELRARVLVSAAGALSDPKTPDIEGLDRFQGKIFHSAQWDHDYDVDGQARRRDRHRRLGDPVRARDRARRRADARLPAHRAVDHAPHRPPDQPARAPPLPPLPAAAAARPRRHLLRVASCWCSASSSSRG